jgi:hypothetical protein
MFISDEIRSPPGSHFWSAAGCGTGSVAVTLVMVPLFSRESVAAGPSQVLEFLSLFRMEFKVATCVSTVLITEAMDFVPGPTTSWISDIMLTESRFLLITYD